MKHKGKRLKMYVPVRTEFIWPSKEYVELWQNYDETSGFIKKETFFAGVTLVREATADNTIRLEQCDWPAGNWGQECWRKITNFNSVFSAFIRSMYADNWANQMRSILYEPLGACVLYIGQAFRYSPENAFYLFNQQIYFGVWYLLDRASLI